MTKHKGMERELVAILAIARIDLSSVLCHPSSVFGGHSKEDPPVPIPNTEVKLFCADGTARATVWESRSPPFFIALSPSRFFCWGFCRFVIF